MEKNNNKEANKNLDNRLVMNISNIILSDQEFTNFMVGVYSIEGKYFLFGNNIFVKAIENSEGEIDNDEWLVWYSYVKSKEKELIKRSINNFLINPFDNQILTLRYHFDYPTSDTYILHEILIRKYEGKFYAINYILDISNLKKIESVFDISIKYEERVVIEKKIAKLSSRQKEVLQLISNGYSSKEIADLLSISNHTVISHRKNLIEKFEAKNTAHLVKKAWSSILST